MMPVVLLCYYVELCGVSGVTVDMRWHHCCVSDVTLVMRWHRCCVSGVTLVMRWHHCCDVSG